MSALPKTAPPDWLKSRLFYADHFNLRHFGQHERSLPEILKILRGVRNLLLPVPVWAVNRRIFPFIERDEPFTGENGKPAQKVEGVMSTIVLSRYVDKRDKSQNETLVTFWLKPCYGVELPTRVALKVNERDNPLPPVRREHCECKWETKHVTQFTTSLNVRRRSNSNPCKALQRSVVRHYADPACTRVHSFYSWDSLDKFQTWTKQAS